MGAPNTINAILKRIQSKYFDDKALVRKSDFMKWIDHKKDFQGNTFNFSVQVAGYGGASHDVAVADALDINGVFREFVVPSISDYKNCTLDGSTTRKVLEGGIDTRYVEYVKQSMDDGYGALEARLASAVFRNGSGSRGQISSGSNVGTATITLANPDDALYFSIGDRVVASLADGGALRTGGVAYVTLAAVDPSAGTLTASGGNWNAGITTVAAGDFLYKAGDASNAGSGIGDYLGLTAWNTVATPSATLFCGVDRTIQPEMLAGLRLPSTGVNIETVLLAAEAYAMRRPSFSFAEHVFVLSTADFGNLQIAKEGARVVSMSNNQYSIGIDVFKVGKALVMSDPFQQDGRFSLVGKGAFELHSNAGVMVNDVDGNKMQRRNGDTYQFQTLIDANFIARKPYGLGTGVFPST